VAGFGSSSMWAESTWLLLLATVTLMLVCSIVGVQLSIDILGSLVKYRSVSFA
jgi:hypothetical protein